MSQLTVATQRLSKGRENRGGRRAKRKEVAAWGERKVKEVGKVGNSGSFPCDSSRSDRRVCQRKERSSGEEDGGGRMEDGRGK